MMVLSEPRIFPVGAPAFSPRPREAAEGLPYEDTTYATVSVYKTRPLAGEGRMDYY